MADAEHDRPRLPRDPDLRVAGAATGHRDGADVALSALRGDGMQELVTVVRDGWFRRKPAHPGPAVRPALIKAMMNPQSLSVAVARVCVTPLSREDGAIAHVLPGDVAAAAATSSTPSQDLAEPFDGHRRHGAQRTREMR